MEWQEKFECMRMEKRRVQRGEEDNGIVIPRHIRSLSGLMSRYIRNHYTGSIKFNKHRITQASLRAICTYRRKLRVVT